MTMEGLVIQNKFSFTRPPRPIKRPRTVSLISCALPQNTIGRSDLQVSNICLGTMLFGEATSKVDAFTMMSTALDIGINFFDSAEMYPIPQRKETQGQSEAILGSWLKQSPYNRSDITIATKIAGPGAMTWLRGGPVALDPANIQKAIDSSLQRLQTDYIDLIQLHWPDRYVPMFGDVDYDPALSYSACPIEDQIEALHKARDAGKIRHIGLSNETPYGLMKFCQHTNIISLQNAYSLTCRTFDAGLAECCHAEGISLLAYSPLAMGLLTGKYLDPSGGPAGARLNKYKGRYAEAESRYSLIKANTRAAVAAYVALAQQWDMCPVQLALRFVLSHPMVASAVTGATSLKQLEELVEAAGQPTLDPDLRTEINAIHAMYPNPTP